MSEMNEKEHKTIGLNIRLAPIENSDQPVLANFTRLNGARGLVFVDFGFLEPAALAAGQSHNCRTGRPLTQTVPTCPV